MNPEFNDFEDYNLFREICYWYVSRIRVYGRTASTFGFIVACLIR